ncbi:carbohydrate ABC transporter permease, partial [Paenibacillus alkaliterrae]|uniref:carbohydrate ABC transporter permease n=1 Tax=Paenibacillus alkaliterrae TaxID=320909 RepID=UPI0039F03860
MSTTMKPIEPALVPLLSEKQKIKKKSIVGWLLVLPTILFLLFWTVYPLIYAAFVSLTNLNLSRPAMQKFVGLLNYKLLLQDATFLTSISQTMRLTFVSIVLELILGYMLAKFFINAKGIPGINVVRTIFILPMMIAPLVIGLMYMYVLNTNLGIVNYVLEQMGIGQISWFGNPDLALYTVIFINVWQWTPFMMILIIAGLNSIPESLVEVAKLEGATWWQKFINLEIPFISHVVAIGIFMRVMENLKMFDVVYATTNG